MYYSRLFYILAGLISLASAHMIMKSPVPFGVSSLNNSPLDGTGADFPCKQRNGVYDVTTMNSIAVGTPQTLSFTGSAVHGGGSCQLSISLDTNPTKQSTFKVIHSIVGGCPASAAGNLGSNDGTTFQFTLPASIPNGQATLAWTWFNKIGNREMYMNCAPIQVTGGASDHSAYDALPDMFVANVPATTCGTVENEDFLFPNPGDSAVTIASTALGSKTLGTACQQPTSGGQSSGQSNGQPGEQQNGNSGEQQGQPGGQQGQPLVTSTVYVWPSGDATSTVYAYPSGNPDGQGNDPGSSVSSDCTESGSMSIPYLPTTARTYPNTTPKSLGPPTAQTSDSHSAPASQTFPVTIGRSTVYVFIPGSGSGTPVTESVGFQAPTSAGSPSQANNAQARLQVPAIFQMMVGHF